MSNLVLIIFFATVILVWLTVLSFFVFRNINQFNRLVKGTKKENLEEILKKIFETQTLNKREISEIGRKVIILEENGRSHIQKFGVLRFNPFNETGGDNSFSVCFLDADADGLILTGLHTREKTRVYAKAIKKGRSEYELSKEELKVIREAMNK